MDVSQDDGTIEVNKEVPSSYPATFRFADYQPIRLTATPPPGYYFKDWSGGISNTGNPVIIMLDSNKSITANFEQIMHTLIIHVNGNGSSSPIAGKHSYPEGTVVNISATPDKGWQFDSWSGNIREPDMTTAQLTMDSDTTTTQLTMDSDMTITANFSEVKLPWWLAIAIIAGILVIGVTIWLLVKKRTILHSKVPGHSDILEQEQK